MPPPPSILRRCLCGILIILFALVLLFPLFQQFSQVPPEKKLSGIPSRTREFPGWTVQSWLSGEFAAAVDAWTGEHIGMRGWLVYFNRQVRYSLFGQVEAAPRRNRAIVIGKAPILYENLLLVDALRPPQIAPDQMENFAFNLARTQRLLKEHGMAFLVILAPNKALIYTNALPAWVRSHVSDSHTDYVAFLDALRRHDVPCLDTMSLFRELLPQYPDLIPAHGIHWSHHGAWIAWQRAIPLLNQQGIFPEIPVPMTEELILDKPSSMNDELRSQLNLFFSHHGEPIPCAYPVAAPLPPGTDPMLDALIVGDSFGFNLMDAMARSRLCRVLHYWFYMKNGRAALPAAFDSRMDRGLPSVEGMGVMRSNDENGIRMLSGKNLVVLVMTTFNIDKFSWGFDRMVNRLYGNPDDNPPLYDEAPVNLED